MPRYELLNNVAHKDLRVTTRFGAEYGDAVATIPVFPTEFADVQREYPIFFRKDDASGQYQAVALLGFGRDENLYLQDGRWTAGYLPAALARGPFLIGQQEQEIEGELRMEPVVHVDMEHPRISRDGTGEAVFLEHGGQSPYLEHIATVLRAINTGVDAGKTLYGLLDELGLLQPVTVQLRFDESNGANLTGLWQIERERLQALDGEALQRLHASGMLEGVYLVLASQYNMRRLIAEKQRRLRTAGAGAANT